MTLRILRDECTGCAWCVSRLPQVFALDRDGIAYILDQEGADRSSIDTIIDGCPALCIQWIAQEN